MKATKQTAARADGRDYPHMIVPPPGPKGTMTRTVLSGQFCAWTAPDTPSVTADINRPAKRKFDFKFMICLLGKQAPAG